MEKLRNFADDRLVKGCVYCDGTEDTRDHVPSRVFLDVPYPADLPVVWACGACNASFSQDEEYLACLIECAIAESTDPDHIKRDRISRTLRHSNGLRARIEAAKTIIEGKTAFTTEGQRILNVVLKLARGHAAFELSQVRRDPPASLWCLPIETLTTDERTRFDSSYVIEQFGEVGSRGSQRTLVTQIKLLSLKGETKTVGLLVNDWIDVQEGRYRFIANDEQNGIRIKIVIAEYLAAEVIWRH